MSTKENKAIEYAQARYGRNNGSEETENELAKMMACKVGYMAGWDEAAADLSVEWHDFHKTPKLYEYVLAVDKKNGPYLIQLEKTEDWEEWVDFIDMERWIYVKDLICKKEA